ncbi:unnamed protein product [Lupinus luteus]|uniref:Uncharacterized protein n=1 Tax=Lupinus luteus TaxID=3873 RepID=A0AAV1WI56_LUPLU
MQFWTAVPGSGSGFCSGNGVQVTLSIKVFRRIGNFLEFVYAKGFETVNLCSRRFVGTNSEAV